jgi:ketosteroid isomerase-like protein
MSKPDEAKYTNEELREEFEKLEREWSQAIVSNDAEAIGRFMADDWLIVGQSGITDKKSFLSLVESGDLTHEMMEGDVKRVMASNDVVIVIARGINNGHYKGQQFASDEWITDVFKRCDGRWQCLLTHLTPAVDTQ